MRFLFIGFFCKCPLTGLREQQEQHAMEDHDARPDVAIRNSAVWKPLSRLFVGRPEAQDPWAVRQTSCGPGAAGSLPKPVETTQRKTCGQNTITDEDAMLSLFVAAEQAVRTRCDGRQKPQRWDDPWLGHGIHRIPCLMGWECRRNRTSRK